jgi:hypothetical protein
MYVLRLRYLSQSQPNAPLHIIDIPIEAYHVVATYLEKVKKIKTQPADNPTVAQFVQLLTLLGTGNKKNTGVRALWRGYRDFVIVYDTYKAFNSP